MTDPRQEPTLFPTGPAQPRPRRRQRPVAPIAVALLVLALLAGGWYFWLARPHAPAASPPAETAAAAPPDANASAPAPALLPPTAEEVVQPNGVTGALEQLLGREAVLKFLQTTDFPRRFAATLDNLGREYAPASVWPVQPTPARFLVAADGPSQVIAPENARRYAPFVAFAASVDAAQAVQLYRRLSPLLEQAWRELGFKDRSLHQRMFEVIDLLLATPEPTQAPQVTLTEVKGPIPSSRPWTRYEYADARLERLAAGQKILLRVGPDHRKVLKAKLQELRRELLRASATPARP